MKISKVEISGFRIYDDPKDATFDFSLREGGIADFVSLYAPNGFGKTSFYDAVEYGVTKSIGRFYIRNKELKKLADTQKKENELPLIRNTKSPPERETYINVSFDPDEHTEEHILRKQWNQNHDFVFDREVLHPFQKVLLSQEWISSVLTEIDGEARYNKLMQAPGLREANNYYRNLNYQKIVLNETVDKLNVEIVELETLIGNEDNENYLKIANSQIKRLADTFNQSDLSKLTLITTQEEVFNLQNLVSDRIITLDEEETISEKQTEVASARTGTNEILSPERYYEQKEEILALMIKREETERKIKLFDELGKLTNELEKKRESKSSLSEKFKLSKQLIDFFQEYQRIAKKLKEKLLSQVEIEDSLKKVGEEFEKANHSQTSKKSELKSTISEIDKLNKSMKQHPAKVAEMKQLRDSIESIDGVLKKQTAQLETLRDESTKTDLEIETLENLIGGIEEDKYSISSLAGNKKLKASVKNILAVNSKISSIEIRIQELDSDIFEQQDLSSKLQKFVEEGLAIANELKDAKCPLCEWNYSSYAELAKTISKNDAFSKVLQELQLNKTQILQEKIELENKVMSEKETLANTIENLLITTRIRRLTRL